MALRMTSLNQMKKGEFAARKGIPADVREAYARLYKVSWEERLKLPANTSTHEAKKRHGEWLAELKRALRPCALLRKVRASHSQGSTRFQRLIFVVAGSVRMARN